MTKVAVAVFCCGLLARAESADDILKRWDMVAKDFHAFTADLKQTSFTKVVNKSDQHNGVVRLKRTDKGVFGVVRYTDDPRTVHFEGDIVEDFHPKANQLDRYDFKKYSSAIRDGLMLGFGTSGKEVRNQYEVMDGGPAMLGSQKTTRIVLVPKEKKAKDLAEKIELWIPEGGNNPMRAKSTEPSGDYEMFDYSNIKLLKLPLKDSDFDFDSDQKPNSSTHIVKN